MEEIGSFFPASSTERLKFRPCDFGNATVGVTVKVGAHVSENDIWHSWPGIDSSRFDSPLVKPSGEVSGYPLGPLRRGPKE